MRRRAGDPVDRRGKVSSAAVEQTAGALASPGTVRGAWVGLAEKLAKPVLEAAADRRLRATMPVVVGSEGVAEDRAPFAHFEAVARLLSGLAPWFEVDDLRADPTEEALRSELHGLAVEALRGGVDPSSPDHFLGDGGPQPLVEAGYLALAILRAPNALFGALGSRDEGWLVDLLRHARRFQPYFNNWLLFAGAVEALLLELGEPDWDAMRIDYAVRQHEQWYCGDGMYGDGPDTHWDYYNSFVTHPFLVQIIDVASGRVRGVGTVRQAVLDRATRYAAVQERLIAPDGSYPPIGRSLAYRCGAFHALADSALRGLLPPSLPPARVRSALSAVIDRQMSVPGTFDEEGWLTIGFAGDQPALAEPYISTGSLYLCASVLLPLGRPPRHPFWSAPSEPWTSARLWSGEDMERDEAL